MNNVTVAENMKTERGDAGLGHGQRNRSGFQKNARDARLGALTRPVRAR
jgi:hypothetical protein